MNANQGNTRDTNNSDKEMQQERLLLDAAVVIYKRMKELNLTRKDLASRLGVTKGMISQYLGGERNMTLRTLADIFTALETRATIGYSSASGWQSLELHNVVELKSWDVPQDHPYEAAA